MKPLPLVTSAFTLSLLQAALLAGPVDVLKERERRVKEVVKNALPSVVAVIGTKQNATGSGVIVSKDGLIMTAGHVTDAAGQELLILFPDGRSVKGVALGANMSRDAGLAKITEEGEWPAVEIGDSTKAKLGDWVVAMGHPGGYDLTRSPPVRFGRIVNKGVMGMLGTDCTLVGGDSGGPLFDLDGKVIGIHSSIGGSLAENRHAPSSVFKNDWGRMVAGEVWGTLGMMTAGVDPNRPMLGVQMSEERGRVVVAGVLPSSPALAAGLQAGDVILQIDDTEPERRDDVIGVVTSRKAGDEVTIRVARGDDQKTFTVKLVRWEDLAGGIRRGDGPEVEPAASGRPRFGVILDAEAEADGATVHDVLADSPAALAGLEVGDVVFEIDGETVDSVESMAARIGAHKPEDEIEIRVRRGDGQRSLKVILGEQ